MRHWFRAVLRMFVTVFGIGYSPVMPGTLGTLAGVALYCLLPKEIFWQAGALLLLLGLGIPACSWAETCFRKKDCQVIVIDETAGFMVTMLGMRSMSWSVLLAGFVLFRLMDIYKLFPVNYLEKLPRGAGVMLDDVGAGIYAQLLLRILIGFL